MKSRKKQDDRELDMHVNYVREFSEKEVDDIITTLASMLITHWHNKESEQQKNDINYEERS